MLEENYSLPKIVTREDWLTERKKLLKEEKEFTRRRDELSAKRRRLPMVEIEKGYEFEGPGGKVSMFDLFEGRRQLIIYHFMWLWKNGEPLDKGCPSCTAGGDEVSDGLLRHLHARNTNLVYVSRGPFPEIQAYKEKRGWKFPFYSSYGSDFNYDFHVSFDESIAPFEYNYRTKSELAEAGLPVDKWDQPFDLHGHSCFLRDGNRVFHTYSMYARGAESVGGSYYWLDLTAFGRQEEWEEPKDRVTTARAANPNFEE